MQNRIASLVALLCLLSIAAYPIASLGQDETNSNDAASGDDVVVDDRSLSDLRRDVIKTEEEFYAAYNKLNDEKDYDVRCFTERPTGTNIKNHVCRANFVTAAYQRHARRNRNNVSSIANQDADPVFAEKSARYQEILETLLAANPDLQAALAEYDSAVARLAAKQEAEDSN